MQAMFVVAQLNEKFYLKFVSFIIQHCLKCKTLKLLTKFPFVLSGIYWADPQNGC